MPRSERRGGYFKGLLDGFRGTGSQPVKPEAEFEETLRPQHFQVAKTVRHGFPNQPTAIAFDPVQRLLAIGTQNGSLRLFGRPGVDGYVQHVLEYPVIQIVFLINEGALISVCGDDSIHLWNLRQKWPEIVHSLKFQKERITCCHLPFQSKWFYIGTERGNVHVVNIEAFILSGYVINWNKAIELSRKTHPGPVVHLSDNPVDSNKLLIGFETGVAVMWDLRNRMAEARFHSPEPLKAISWHHEGKQFMCCHSDGSLVTWNIRIPTRPLSVIYPHAKTGKDGKMEPCRAIYHLEWKTTRTSDSYVIFTGGLPYDRTGKTPCLTVIHGKNTTVLEMEHNIIDFVTLCDTPWQSDFQDPYAIVALLYNDLVVVDLTSPGYPCFQNPYPMDLHESPVTFCTYLADCPTDLIPAFYSVGCKGNKRTGFSDKDWPIDGGEWGVCGVSYPEIIITGHADGSLKFWDASSVSLQVLYKLKTSKVFEKPKSRSLDGQDEDPFAVEQAAFCPEGRILSVAGASSQVLVFNFNKQEVVEEVVVLEIPIIYEIDEDPDCSPEYEYSARPSLSGTQQGSHSSASEESGKKVSEHYVPLRVKSGPLKKSAGFQVDLVCLTPWVDGEPPGRITALSVNSHFGLLAYGNESGLAVVDIIQKTCLLNMGTPDLYGSSDPYQRIPRSPKKNANTTVDISSQEQDRCRSPISDQFPNSTDESAPSTAPSSQSSSGSTSPSEPSSPGPNATKPPRPFPRKKRKNLARLSSAPPSVSCLPDPPTAKMVTDMQDINGNVKESCVDEMNGTIPSQESGHKKNVEHCVLPPTRCPEVVCTSDQIGETMQSNCNMDHIKAQQGLTNESGQCRSQSSSALTTDIKKWGQSKRRKRKCKGKIIDLRDDCPLSPVAKMMYKIDSSFSRSRSSSMSSLENVSSEAIQCLTFSDSFCRRTDVTAGPGLWVGTSLGSVLSVVLTVPPSGESRLSQPIIASPSGTIFRLKGSILSISFLDGSGTLVPSLYVSWKGANTDNKEREERRIRPPSGTSRMRVSPTSSSSDFRDCQYAVMASEKQARLVALPSQTCLYKVNLTETSFVVRANVIAIKGIDNVCLACYVATGNIIVYSLPSFKPLLDVDFLPLVDIRIARTFCFSNNGHGLYLCSPTELQKFTISSTFCENLQEMLGTLFLVREMPEAPKQSFFKGLFSGGPSSLDREELFGEASGKASKSVARHIPGNTNVDALRAQSSSIAGELARARQGLTERGEALSQLEERTARMMSEAESFATATHQLMSKYRDKKWYQF